ncbi:MAG: class I SAM-dependent methyltransferase [Lachnospira sp.]
MTIEELLEQCIQKNLIDLTISGLKKKNEELPVKIKVRPVAMKDKIEYQVSEFIGRKVFHKNYKKDELKKKITDWMQEDYKQAQFTMTDATAQILSGKHSQTVKYKKCKEVRVQRDLSHNRTKRYILPEGTPVGFLIDLGVMTKEGKIVRQKYDKYHQINRFLEFVEDILPQLSKEREQTIIDFGCGKSYLTFAMYYYLKELKGYDIRIIGLDLKEDVIAHCNELKDKYGYGKLSFLVGDIASYTDVDAVDMVVTLHACDTATDYALAKAVQWGAKVILSVPCCQHEANRMMENELLQPVLQYGILKERMAAIMTDAVRANLLTAKGYDTQILEFIDMEHTPKNLLIRAVYTGKDSENAAEALKNMEEALHLNLTLNKLLGE